MEKAGIDFIYGDTLITKTNEEGVTSKRKTAFLCQVTDPEEKRLIIGDVFMSVASRVGLCQLPIPCKRSLKKAPQDDDCFIESDSGFPHSGD